MVKLTAEPASTSLPAAVLGEDLALGGVVLGGRDLADAQAGVGDGRLGRRAAEAEDVGHADLLDAGGDVEADGRAGVDLAADGGIGLDDAARGDGVVALLDRVADDEAGAGDGRAGLVGRDALDVGHRGQGRPGADGEADGRAGVDLAAGGGILGEDLALGGVVLGGRDLADAQAGVGDGRLGRRAAEAEDVGHADLLDAGGDVEADGRAGVDLAADGGIGLDDAARGDGVVALLDRVADDEAGAGDGRAGLVGRDALDVGHRGQ